MANSIQGAIAVGISRGLADMGGTITGCTPDLLALYVVRQIRLDDEEFCPVCFAGTESSEHYEKCGR
jgi:hypothetical protein